jgi:hypothetical protein
MNTKLSLKSIVSLGAALVLLSACGGAKAITMSDVPAYPGATELKAGDSSLASTLANNVAQNDQLKQAMGGAGTKIEQKGWQLPAAATWEDVNKFYEEKLKGMGFSTGLGGVGGIAGGLINNVAGAAIQQANQGNDSFKTAMFSKDKQVLTVIMLADPVKKDNKQLIMSLNTN